LLTKYLDKHFNSAIRNPKKQLKPLIDSF